MAMVQVIHGGGDSVEKNVSTTSMLIVGLSVVLVLLLPLLLSVDLGTWHDETYNPCFQQH